jgi:hypothetical protein
MKKQRTDPMAKSLISLVVPRNDDPLPIVAPTGPQREYMELLGLVTLLKLLDEPTHKGMVRSDMSKPALIFFSLQEYTQQNPLSKF